MLKDAAIAQQKATNIIEESCIYWLLQVARTLLCTTGLQPVSKGLKTDSDREQQGASG